MGIGVPAEEQASLGAGPSDGGQKALNKPKPVCYVLLASRATSVGWCFGILASYKAQGRPCVFGMHHLLCVWSGGLAYFVRAARMS